jgi:hypothetical protein
MPRRKSPAIDPGGESVLTWLFVGLIGVSSMLGLLSHILH